MTMEDTGLYQYLLGLKSPWSVSRVGLDVERQRVDVWAEHEENAVWVCPECQKESTLYDHAEERLWRHLDSCQFKTFLHARIPRVKCMEHGVLQVLVPWAEPKSRFTALFERLAIDVLRECDITGVTRILKISWDEAWNIMERAVERGKLRKQDRVVKQIGVDEKAIAKGHNYLTLVSDIDDGTVEHIADDRKQISLEGYYQSLTEEQLEGIEAVAMDMWDPYIAATRAYVPSAESKIVFDRFHIMGYVGKAVNTVRKQEHRERMKEGDETLKGSKYLWLYSKENVPENRRNEFAVLQKLELKVGRAWAIKETLRKLWHYSYPGAANKFWKRWYFWATHSRLKPIIEAAGTIKRHIANVLTYIRHRITNAVSEGLNSKIQTIKKMAYGFQNKEHFKTAIYFHCGGLDMYPC
jgi:transposase